MKIKLQENSKQNTQNRKLNEIGKKKKKKKKHSQIISETNIFTSS